MILHILEDLARCHADDLRRAARCLEATPRHTPRRAARRLEATPHHTPRRSGRTRGRLRSRVGFTLVEVGLHLLGRSADIPAP